MPIDNKNLGKYRRPGIYINEYDQSIIELPIQDVLINLVPGFSKKGPFNSPIRVDSPAEFESIFGPIDKNLENKGSFFHRTVEDMLNTGPIWALSLLKTDPTRDTLEWESISAAAQYDNGPKTTAPYERFFNRQDFWERDTESFGDIVIEQYQSTPTTQPDPSKDLLSITNMGTTRSTVWLFKSSVTGFDVSAEQWYGGIANVPLFINPKDLISDYIISVMAVAGDWTNTDTLAVDSYWGKYFDSNGLIKSQVSNFWNDTLTNQVAYYDVSLIPNFRDLNNVDMYIKDVINSDTDKTGLFCYYNEDALLSQDFYKGNIDLVGQTLVGSSKKTINFLSYFGSISESLTYTEKQLDSLNSPSNVFGNYASHMDDEFISGRTASYTNWYTNISVSGDTSTGHTDLYAYKVVSIDGSYVITLTGTSYTMELGDILYFNKSFGIIDYTTPYYVTNVTSNTITVSTVKGGTTTQIVSGSSTNIFVYSLKQNFVDGSNNPWSYIIGQTIYSGDTALTAHNLFFDPFVISQSGATYSRYDVLYLNSDYSTVHTLKGNQITGTSPTKPNYLLNSDSTIVLGYVKITYNGISGNALPTFSYIYYPVSVNAGASYLPLLLSTDVTGLSGTTIGGVNYLDLTFVGTKGSVDYTDYNKLRKLKIFTEIYTNIITNKSVIINYHNGDKFSIVSPTIYGATTTTDAYIRIFFDSTTQPFDYFDKTNGKFLIYYIDNEFVMDPINSVNQLITTNHPLAFYSAGDKTGIVAKYSNLYLDYYNGIINNGDYFYVGNISGDTQTKVFLKMWLDTNGNLTIKFVDEYDVSFDINLWDANYGEELVIYSDKGNLKETVEIENPSAITDPTNTRWIYVDKTRYAHIVRGMYLEAYYDKTYYDDPTGEGYLLGMVPRKLVRITDIKNDPVNSNWKILYADGSIKIGGTYPEYYTTSYTEIDEYFNSYNGITLKPFTVHPDSMPNGTDARQMDILTVVDKTTNLAKGLANKNRISWRYLIDAFGLGLTHNSKQEFVDVCGAKLNCLGFINMPSQRQLKTSLDPSFINDDRTLNTTYLMEGGNPNKNPSFLYSFGEGVGRSCVGYFFPYVKDVNDQSKFIPPSAKIAKAYMNKFLTTTSGIYPWTIVAGSILGKLPDVNATEMRFTNDNLTDLMDMGANPIDFTQNRGYYINSENTAQVFPYSSLSVMHSREVLIELENRLYDMLLNYQWRFNTGEIRNEIKYRADQICKELLDTNALYAFKNVMDKSNNTDYIIDLQMGVLDTYIEIIRGMGTIVNNITILKKGTIQSSGFLPKTSNG